ncbi:hypothetical protein L873DRAFT_1722824 [Choiromyces venosus 120613-1]|uniref:Uncharacterized protein n=1 Tax=Choiromyces venosus 120613-1 TaxID=1336337 RepID=A0A3N4IST5_9PEZI|nr:hypothetical protein L873DRAFT_1722824 [Choiromyces venosus 120613-1]
MFICASIVSRMRLKRPSRTEYPDSLARPSSPDSIDLISVSQSTKIFFVLSTVFPCHPSVDAGEASETWSGASERGKSRSEILIS